MSLEPIMERLYMTPTGHLVLITGFGFQRFEITDGVDVIKPLGGVVWEVIQQSEYIGEL